MTIGDYDQDGRATEFPITAYYYACGHSLAILIGIDKFNEKLHAIGTAENPVKPLYLNALKEWTHFKKSKGRYTAVTHGCGDHGGVVQEIITLKADKKGIHAVRKYYQCDDKNRPGKLINKEIQ